MSDKPLGFGVIGLGVGKSRAKMVAECPDAELIAVCDLDEERLNPVAEEHGCDRHTDYKEMAEREDIDCILVMTPSGLHCEMAIECLKRGKHVATTKPMDVRLDIIDEAIATAEEESRVLAVDFGRRYSDDCRRIKRAMDEGRFGRPILATIEMKWWRTEDYYAGWRGTWEFDGGGSLANQGIHQIDLVQWIMGPVTRVVGDYAVMAHENCETEDLGMALAEFESGAKGSFITTTTYEPEHVTRVGFHGTEGAVLLDSEEPAIWQFRDEEEEEPLPPGPANIVEDMVGCIREGKEPACTGPEGRKSVEVLRAILRSADTGVWVDLPIEGA